MAFVKPVRSMPNMPKAFQPNNDGGTNQVPSKKTEAKTGSGGGSISDDMVDGNGNVVGEVQI